MPLREEICTRPACPGEGVVEERFYHSAALSPRPCEHCGGTMERLASRFGVVWTGPLTQRYRDRDKEGYHAPEGMDVWTRKSTGGKPKPLHLNDWSDVRRYCKAEGLADPREVGRNVAVSDDGKSLKSGMGEPGVEI